MSIKTSRDLKHTTRGHFETLKGEITSDFLIQFNLNNYKYNRSLHILKIIFRFSETFLKENRQKCAAKSV